MTVRAVRSTASFASAAQPTLAQGASGASVVALQNALRSAGFNPGPSDGRFGPGTRAAVIAFQRARGLSADGVVGPQTWGALGRAPSPSPPPAPTGGGQPMLSYGARGAAVQQMQQDLAKAGFNPGGVDGVFGPGTLSALERFQSAHGLSADGVCGPKTWGALGGSSFTPAPPSGGGGSPTLQQGATGAAVTHLQQMLQAAGCSPGGIDGVFGPGTAGAVMTYQASRGLSVDGVVGPATWGALNSNAPAVHPTNPGGGGVTGGGVVGIAQSVLGQNISSLKYSGPLAQFLDKWPGNNVCCANFVSACLEKAGQINLSEHNDSVYYLANNLRSDPRWNSVGGLGNAQPGDVVCFNVPGEGSFAHVEIFEGWQNGQPMFIGSNNVNADGSQAISQGSVGYGVDAVFHYHG